MAHEARLWEWLRDGLKGTPGLHMYRVENLVATGDPDVTGCYRGTYFGIELKGCNRPVGPATPLDFEVRPSQLLWHKKHVKCGGNSWIYIRVGIGTGKRAYLVQARHVPVLYAGVSEDMLRALAVLPPVHTAQQVLTCVSHLT